MGQGVEKDSPLSTFANRRRVRVIEMPIRFAFLWREWPVFPARGRDTLAFDGDA